MNALAYFIIVTSMLNMMRMGVYLVGSDVYTLRNLRRRNASKDSFTPKVSVVVPAYNERLGITRTLEALHKSDYPADKMEIIVVDDGSRDGTATQVRKFIGRSTPRQVSRTRLERGANGRFIHTARRKDVQHFKTILVRQKNSGKAAALNNAIINYASGDLIMCLDADSMIDSNGIKNAVQYFRDEKVVALASNVNIIEDGTLLGLAQRFEYLISYQMKKAQTTLRVEYIIGGIGSMFRKEVLERVQYYDSNTMTEDIDLTMKIIANGVEGQKVVYASDCLTYTEGVPSFKSLIKQRYRWKYGRLQTFFKNPQMFFSRDKRHNKLLTWYILPLALFQEMMYSLEPIIVGYILFNSIRFQDARTLLAALMVISFYTSINIWASEHLKVKEQIRLTLLAPAMYFLLYIMSVVEYAALIRVVRELKFIPSSIKKGHTTWVSPERSGVALKV